MQEEIQRKTGYIVMRDDGAFDVDANTCIDQFSEELNVKIPEVRIFCCSEVDYLLQHSTIYIQLVIFLKGGGFYCCGEVDSLIQQRTICTKIVIFLKGRY